MLKQFVLVAALIFSFSSHCYADPVPRAAAAARAVPPQVEALQTAEALLDEIVIWLASNFDLPAAADHPAIAFVSNSKLAMLRATDGAFSHDFRQDAGSDEPAARRVVALYDNNLKTIILPDNWVGQSPADKSILVHEMVHHIQNIAAIKYECPMAREKLAYIAQDKWLEQFGLSLANEFKVDMFTVVVTSACIH